MRLPATVLVAAMVALAGCANDVHDARVTSLTPGTGGTFTFKAQTNTLMTENDDGAAEQLRLDWLADALTASGFCRTGYVITYRRFAQPDAGPIFGNGGDIIYDGRCL
jgi:hypothetical protein